MALIGYNDLRTNKIGAHQFAAMFLEHGWDVHVESFAADAVHIDMLFSMLAPGLALIDEERLPGGFQRFLEQRDIELVSVDPSEAMFWGCNVVALGHDRVLSSQHATITNGRLRALGLDVVNPDLSVFAADGGSARCLTMPLARHSTRPE